MPSRQQTSRRLEELQHRIGWICQTGRLMAAGYALWTLWLVVSFWGSMDLPGRRYAMIAGISPIEITGPVRFAGFGLTLTGWLMVAATSLTAWRLFSAYLEGSIFTPKAANLLRSTALLGVGAILLDLVMRPLIMWVVAGTMPTFAKASYYYFSPHDLALLIFLVSLFAIAHIFKVAAELAAENAEIL